MTFLTLPEITFWLLSKLGIKLNKFQVLFGACCAACASSKKPSTKIIERFMIDSSPRRFNSF